MRYGALALSFEGNRGQSSSKYAYVAHGPGYALGLGRGEVQLTLARKHERPQALRLATPGGHLGSPEAQHRLGGRVNYFIGRDRSQWLTNVPTFGRIEYPQVWPGIDLVFHGQQGRLEYDIDLAAGANPSQVALRFAGVRSARSDGAGGAVLRLRRGKLLIRAPRAVQDGRVITSRLLVRGNTIGLSLGAYDRRRSLVVDPDLIYSTYLGGSGADSAGAIAVDSNGNAYVTGQATGPFPTTSGAFQTASGGQGDAFVTKLDPTGGGAVYSTYLGGSRSDTGNGIAVDPSGNAYVGGTTQSANFPTTSGAFQTSWSGGNEAAFVTKLTPTGALGYSTDLGGTIGDVGQAIAVDAAGDAFLTGTTGGSFPITAGAYQSSPASTQSAFVTELSAAGSIALYSTYLGGSGHDLPRGIAVDGNGEAYVTGFVQFGAFPTTPGAFETTDPGGGISGFLTKLNPSGSGLEYSTYIGGSGGAVSRAVAVDASGAAYLTGDATPPFPVTPNAYQTAATADTAFVAKLNPAGSSLDYGTYLGAGAAGAGIAVDANGFAYITGQTGPAFPVTGGAFQPTYGGGSTDAFLAKVSPDGGGLPYATYLGGSTQDFGVGIALDPSGGIYSAGATAGSFPVTAGAFQTTYGGGNLDAYVAKLNVPAPSCHELRQTVPHNQATPLALPCSDPNSPLSSLTILTPPSHGSLGPNDLTTGQVTYTPVAGYSGLDSFTYRGSSANGTAIGNATLSIAAAPPPSCSDSALTVNEPTAATVALSCSADGDPLSISVLSGPSHGTLTSLSGDTATYTPAAGYTGPDAITFRATDTANAAASPTATLYLTVIPRQQGLTGPTGPAGPRGPTGPAGQNGQLELVKCVQVSTVVRVHGHKRRITREQCTARLVSGPVKFTTSRAIRATLARAGHIYASGPARLYPHRAQLLLSPLRRLTRGRYTLTITRGHRTLTRRTVTLR